jgi:hypothetical protein
MGAVCHQHQDVQVRLQRDRNEQVEGMHGEHEVQLLLDREVLAQFTVKPAKDDNYELIDAHLKKRFHIAGGQHDLGVTFLPDGSPVLERLRQLGPLSAPNPTLTAPPPQPAPQLPPANPEPGWFEPVAPIRVPVPTAQPAAQAPAPLPLPELLGVVQVPGRGGTAIFNTATGSITAAVGETIGSSGWQLQSVASDQVQVSHQGLVRSLSLSGR